MRARTVHLVLGGALLAGWQGAILLTDYWIELTERYAIYPGPLPQSTPALGAGNLETKARQIEHVYAYAVTPGGAVVGEGDGGWFIAQADGTVRRFASRSTWQAAVQLLPGGAETARRLRSPSRWHDRRFQLRQAAWAAVTVLWAFVTARSWRRERAGRGSVSTDSAGSGPGGDAGHPPAQSDPDSPPAACEPR